MDDFKDRKVAVTEIEMDAVLTLHWSYKRAKFTHAIGVGLLFVHITFGEILNFYGRDSPYGWVLLSFGTSTIITVKAWSWGLYKRLSAIVATVAEERQFDRVTPSPPNEDTHPKSTLDWH